MKTRLLLTLLLMLSMVESVRGQSSIWYFPGCITDTTIIREWKDGSYLVYSRSGSSHKVTLHDDNASTAVSVQLPSYVRINDFRIANDSVFAGGYMLNASSKQGLLACFDINDMLGGSGSFQCMIFNPSHMINDCCDVDYYDQVTEVKRITLFKDGSLTRIAYVARNNILHSSTGPVVYPNRVGYGDAAFSGGIWTVNYYHYNKDGIEEYTDIACTDNHIVVPARDTVNEWLHFVVLDRIADYAYYCHPDAPDIYLFSDHTVADRQVTVTECGNERVAMAYNYRDALNPGIAVKILDVSTGVPVLLHGVDIPLPSSAYVGTVRDIRYSLSGNCLWLLTDTESPVTGIWNGYVFRIDLGNVYAGFYEARFVPGWKLYSLDHYNGNGFITSGCDNGELTVYHDIYGVEYYVCGDGEKVHGVPATPALSVISRHHCPTLPTFFPYNIPFTTFEEEAIHKCKSEE